MKINEQRVLTKIEENDVVNGVLKIDGVEVVGVYSVANFFDLKIVELKDGLRMIGTKAFTNCAELKTITIPQSVIKISGEAFSACSKLEEIVIPNKVTAIEHGLFEDCFTLRRVSLPEGVTKIDENAFLNCKSLTDINLPASLEAIDTASFEGCKSLEELIIPDNVFSLGKGAFLNCERLREVRLPENIKLISNGLFEKCRRLKRVKIPKNVKIIYSTAFADCSSLFEVDLPDDVEYIDQHAFSGCESIRRITLPSKLAVLGKYCFKDCYGLTSICIPEKLQLIEHGCFENCLSLREVVMPEGITEIEEDAFKNCVSLENISLPANLEKIGKSAFADCTSLKEVTINRAIIDKNAFKGCELDQIVLGINSKFLDIAPKGLKYLTKIDNRFYLTSDYIDQTSLCIEGSNLTVGAIMALWDERENLKLTNKHAQMYNAMFENLGREKFCDFYKNANLKFFSQVEKLVDPSKWVSYKSFCKMFYNLGGFTHPFTEKRVSKSGREIEQTIDYAQKVCEFVKEKLSDEGIMNAKIVGKSFYRTNPDGLKREFTDFILDKDNLEQIIKKGHYYLTKVYNDFEVIQRINTSKKGRLRRLKPTFKVFDEYVNQKDFQGVTDDNRELAELIAKYYMRQNFFDESLKILDEWKREGGKKQILKKPIADPLETLDSIEETIADSAKQTLKTLDQQIYTYQWLDKDSPYNFILGKLCQCCAYLEGMGYGIMKASIVHPDIQNLVIKQNGEIVAKATTYVNKDEGYALLNTIEVSDEVKEENKEYVFKKLKQAVKDFAIEYNLENPKAQLKVVNIGMSNNKLAYFVRVNCKRAKNLLASPLYASYGKEGLNYNADSDFDQYTLWERG